MHACVPKQRAARVTVQQSAPHDLPTVWHAGAHDSLALPWQDQLSRVRLGAPATQTANLGEAPLVQELAEAEVQAYGKLLRGAQRHGQNFEQQLRSP